MDENAFTRRPRLPAEIVLAPAWWHDREGITFDESFFFHPARRVEEERRMERALYERWGRFGLGEHRHEDRPEIGAVHLAAGFLLSEMLGCRVEYREDAPPQVVPAERDSLAIDPEAAFRSPAWKRFEALVEALETRFGYVTGDVNFAGVLNLALDLRGEALFLDFFDRPEESKAFLSALFEVIDRFTRYVERKSGTTSLSVNRTVRHLEPALFLHSACSLTMISTDHYERFLAPFDAAWSRSRRPFGIHYCGEDPHRYGDTFARLPVLDFLDVGAGGDPAALRQALPRTFLNLRLSPVEMARSSPTEVSDTVERLVAASGDPDLTGVCCINMDEKVADEAITALLATAERLREGS